MTLSCVVTLSDGCRQQVDTGGDVHHADALPTLTGLVYAGAVGRHCVYSLGVSVFKIQKPFRRSADPTDSEPNSTPSNLDKQ